MNNLNLSYDDICLCLESLGYSLDKLKNTAPEFVHDYNGQIKTYKTVMAKLHAQLAFMGYISEGV